MKFCSHYSKNSIEFSRGKTTRIKFYRPRRFVARAFSAIRAKISAQSNSAS
ncbi:hypothetical protein CAMGR0001_1823 [Campylobacter gracilis RM3268]|uniref:Uncharacterized protein n=1 Tax=Campylobacter gracilis RM3268 TaxID=553220 RepID=C8PEC2_9BACT|nr:hypothetical protein CAMGR0001_1823 [Campylobacter gracilis RM3268]